MRLYLHIGTEKTGTTTVQKFCRQNRERLAQYGVCYPKIDSIQCTAAVQDIRRGMLGGVPRFASEDMQERFRDALLDRLRQDWSAAPCHTVILSNEHMSSHLITDEEVERLRQMFAADFEQVRIVVYIRRQDDYLLSTYSTAVKTGSTELLHLPNAARKRQRYDHSELLSRWSRVYGRDTIICRRFEKAALKDGDIVEDFLDAIGLDTALPLERQPSVNESLDAVSLDFLRRINEFLPRFNADEKINPLRGDIVAHLSAISSGPLLTLTDQDLTQFMAEFADSNRAVAQEYFGGAREDGDPLFAPAEDKRPRVEEAALTVDRTVEICAWLWRKKQEEIAALQDKLERRRLQVTRLKAKQGV